VLVNLSSMTAHFLTVSPCSFAYFAVRFSCKYDLVTLRVWCNFWFDKSTCLSYSVGEVDFYSAINDNINDSM